MPPRQMTRNAVKSTKKAPIYAKNYINGTLDGTI